MARVQGPLHSDSASGTFAGSLVFSTWKGRKVCRERVDPTNPKTALQIGVRAMMGWLAKAWADILDANDRASWDATAEALQISPFNAFMANAMNRWDDSDTFFAKEGDTPASCSITITGLTTTGSAGCVDISITPSGAGAAGFIVYRDDAEITTPSRATVVKVLNADGANAVTFTDSDLAAGTYHYRAAAFNDTGGTGTVKADQTAVVT